MSVVVRCFLKVTGDNRTTAEALAEELDLPKDRILASVLPKDKVTKVGCISCPALQAEELLLCSGLLEQRLQL
jgi:cation transport ATPase